MSTNQERAGAGRVLGPDHPLAAVMTQLSVSTERCLAVSMALAIGVYALIHDLSIGAPLTVASVPVVRAVSSELGEVARLVREDGALRGLVGAERLVTDGWSPLYGDGVTVLPGARPDPLPARERGRRPRTEMGIAPHSRLRPGVVPSRRGPPRAEVTVVRSLLSRLAAG